MSRIVITEFMDAAAVDALAASHDVVYDPGLVDDRSRLLDTVRNADAQVVRNATTVDIELLDAAPGVRVVGRLGVGLDNIDLGACDERSIVVAPATGANADAVAEYVITSVLMLLRGAYAASSAVIAGEWPRTELVGLEASGRTLGLLGYGDIARRVARRAQSLGMDVIAHDPLLDPGDRAWNHTTSVGLDRLFADSDAVSLHVPLTASTEGLVDADRIETMRPDAVLVNTSRGGIVDEEALVEAIRSGSLRGAALDVFSDEPVTADTGRRFADVPNLILTPHIAGITEESSRRVGDVVASRVLDVLEGAS